MHTVVVGEGEGGHAWAWSPPENALIMTFPGNSTVPPGSNRFVAHEKSNHEKEKV